MILSYFSPNCLREPFRLLFASLVFPIAIYHPVEKWLAFFFQWSESRELCNFIDVYGFFCWDFMILQSWVFCWNFIYLEFCVFVSIFSFLCLGRVHCFKKLCVSYRNIWIPYIAAYLQYVYLLGRQGSFYAENGWCSSSSKSSLLDILRPQLIHELMNRRIVIHN